MSLIPHAAIDRSETAHPIDLLEYKVRSSATHIRMMRDGFARINVQAFMHDLNLKAHDLAIRCMVGSWASMLNLSRKGNAKEIQEIGRKAFGKEEFERAIEECLSISEEASDEESEGLWVPQQ